MRHAILLLLFLTWTVQAQTTKEEQSSLTPDKVLADLMDRNSRFVSGNPRAQDIKARVNKSTAGQYPKAVILSCPSDSAFRSNRFSTRESVTSSSAESQATLKIEISLAPWNSYEKLLAGAKLVFVLGHSEMWRREGRAATGAELGNLTGLLAKIKTVLVNAVQGFKADERNSKN